MVVTDVGQGIVGMLAEQDRSRRRRLLARRPIDRAGEQKEVDEPSRDNVGRTGIFVVGIGRLPQVENAGGYRARDCQAGNAVAPLGRYPRRPATRSTREVM